LFCCSAKEEEEGGGGGGGQRKESGKQRERKEGRGDRRRRRGEGNRRFEIFNSNSMGRGRGPNTADSFIDSLIGSEIRYEGILYIVDTDNSNITLQNGVLLEHFGCWKPVSPPVYFQNLRVSVSSFCVEVMGCVAACYAPELRPSVKGSFPSLLSVLK
jgi:hypothetical protein